MAECTRTVGDVEVTYPVAAVLVDAGCEPGAVCETGGPPAWVAAVTVCRVFPLPAGVGAKPAANFAVSDATPVAGQVVSFADMSRHDPTSWLWEFGDGGESAEESPSYAFAVAGDYVVKLTATNEFGSSVRRRPVSVSAVGTATPIGLLLLITRQP